MGQRRSSRIVHDERGNARIEFTDENASKLLEDRIPLEIVDDDHVSRGRPVFNPRRIEKGWNPYQTVGTPRTAPGVRVPGTTPRTKKDLRRLSEWIQLKRRIEERKLRGSDDED